MDEKPKALEPKNPREIVKAAVQYFKSVSDKVEIKKIRLEEIIQDSEAWHVTLSYPQQDDDSIFGMASTRDYKEFTIDPISGQVKSMKIKKL